jgi:hypothetical protein
MEAVAVLVEELVLALLDGGASLIRRMSIWVVGVPLPGKKLSALSTTRSLPSISRTLPLRTELAMIFTR